MTAELQWTSLQRSVFGIGETKAESIIEHWSIQLWFLQC